MQCKNKREKLIAKTKQSIAIGKALKDRKKGNGGNNNGNPSTGSGLADNDNGNDNGNQAGNNQQPSGPGNPNSGDSQQPDRPSGDNPNINYGGDLDEVPSEV